MYSFFEYSQVADLLASKYSLIGSRVYAILARMCARYFVQRDLLANIGEVAGIAVDDVPRRGYSHTAIILKEFCIAQNKRENTLFQNLAQKFVALRNLNSENISKTCDISEIQNLDSENKTNLVPLYSALVAQNSISYAGKPLAFRNENLRNFKLAKTPRQNIAILFDDLITSGSTLTQAHNALVQHNITPIFAITLADARF